MEHFARFNIKKSFIIDLKQLKKNYLQLQIKYHPDKAQNNEEEVYFLQTSIELNAGYKILTNDYLRAEYLLQLEGINIDEKSRNIDPTILLEALEDRERLEDISKLDELERFRQAKLDQKKQILQQLGYAFNSKDFTAALSGTIKLKYNIKFLEDITNKINGLNASN